MGESTISMAIFYSKLVKFPAQARRLPPTASPQLPAAVYGFMDMAVSMAMGLSKNAWFIRENPI